MNNHIYIYFFLVLLCIFGSLVSFITGMEIGLSASVEEYEKSIIPALSVLGAWIGAFATCTAVIVSLWLAFKQLNQDKVILDCRLDMTLIPGYQDDPCIGLSVVSKGNKPANVLSVSWFGEGAKTAMWVAKFNQHSETLPKVLSYGQQLHILHVPKFEIELAKYVQEHMNGKYENLYLSLNTSTGSKKIKVNDSMLNLIRTSQSTDKSSQGTEQSCAPA